MSSKINRVDQVDRSEDTVDTKRGSQNLLSLSIGIVYVWFGSLKFVPNLSPAEGLAKDTILELTFGLVPSDISIVLLALWETCVGLMLIFSITRYFAVRFALLHILLTFSPLLLFPEKVYSDTPFALTLLGQYIAKNIVILGVLVCLMATTSRPCGKKSHTL